MSFVGLLINTCDIERYTVTGMDAYGQPIKAWVAVYPDEPCRLVAGGAKEVQINAELVLVDNQLFVGDIGVVEQDRIVVNEFHLWPVPFPPLPGGSIEYEVVSVIIRQNGVGGHHRHLYLRTVR